MLTVKNEKLFIRAQRLPDPFIPAKDGFSHDHIGFLMRR